MSELINTTAGEGSSHHHIPHIGAFVLETLTLGMYGEPCHTLREYVQNSFDAIRSAQRTGFLKDQGKVSITIDSDAITIKDNGLGISADQAWKTLTSVGASKKDRIRDAGFRGIGRLAGMAYCNELTFRTTFPGETTLTSIDFNCQKLLTAMDPDGGGDFELVKLLSAAILFSSQDDVVNSEDHFFEVILRGLSNAPDTLKNPDKVCSYLSQTVPVGFDPSWSRTGIIEENYKLYFGSTMETIDVYVNSNGNSQQILKPYGDTYQHAKGMMKLRDIDFFLGEESRYWGWVGRLENSAAVTDWNTRGLRVRVRNIQVDSTEIIERLFTEVKPSFGRFSSYYVGEIHIEPGKVIPNARRDGFEELQEWIDIKRSLITNICQPLSSDAYEASKRGGYDVGGLVTDIDKLIARSKSIAENPHASYDQVIDLMNAAKRHRRLAFRLLKVVGDIDEAAVDMGEQQDQKAIVLQDAAKNIETVEDQARMLIGRFLDQDKGLTSLKERLRQEILNELLDVVNAFVDPGTYHKIKEKLARRL